MLDSALAKRVRLVGLDIDGVMTDAGVYMGVGSSGPVELKCFSTQDSVGIKILMEAGLEVVVVSGRVSEATRLRAEELGITEVIQEPDARKLPPFEALLDRIGIRMEDVAFLGDDLPDLPVLRRVGLPVAVQNAVLEVKEAALFTTSRAGGSGAVREFVEVLLKARGEWAEAVDRYLTRRGGASRSAS